MTEAAPSNCLPGPTGDDNRECAEGYRGELFRTGNFRVAVCRDGIQWLLQRRRTRISPGGVAWDNLGYCRTRSALMRLYRERTGQDAAEFSFLPEHIAAVYTSDDPEGT